LHCARLAGVTSVIRLAGEFRSSTCTVDTEHTFSTELWFGVTRDSISLWVSDSCLLHIAELAVDTSCGAGHSLLFSTRESDRDAWQLWFCCVTLSGSGLDSSDSEES